MISLILVVINFYLSVAALDAPLLFKNEEQHQTSLTFSWKPPSNQGGLKNSTLFSIDNNTLLSIANTLLSIDKYYIECTRRNDREIVVAEFSGSTTRGTVDGLAVYSIYFCKIQATSGGTWSTSITQRTLKGAPCMQPLGMENSIIPDNRLTLSNLSFIGLKISNARLNSPSMWCSRYAYVQIDLGRIMTITGLVIQGDTQGVTNVNIKYAVTISNDLVDLWEERITGSNKKRNFTYPGNKYTKRHWFYQNAFTAHHIRIYPVEQSKVVCMKVELYGCSETCSSLMKSDFNPKMNDATKVLSPNLYSSNSWCSSAGEFLRYDFGMEVTLTSILVQTNATKPVHNFQVRFGNNLKSLSIVKRGASNKMFIANKANNSIITHWFDIPLICSIIDIIPQSSGGCIKIGFTGCLTSCMNKLGVERRKPGITLSASSSYSNKNLPDNARLNSLRNAWARNVGDPNIWLQVCFNETIYIFGVALQGLGYAWNDRIKTYKMKYGYKHDSVIYDYKINNITHVFTGNNNRYKTQLAILPTMLNANCIRLHDMECNNKNANDQGCAGRLEIMGCNGDKLPGVVISRLNNSLQCAAFGTHPKIQWSLNDKIITNDENYTITEIGNQNATTLYKSLLTFRSNIDVFLLRFGKCDNQGNGTLKCTKKYMCAYQYMFQHYFISAKSSSFVLSKIYKAPSQPRELKAIVMSPSHVKLIWKQPLHINGILKHYLVTLKGFKPYNSSFLHQKTIVVKYTKVDVQNLYPGTTYFFEVKTENYAFVGPASNVTTAVTPYDTPSQPRELKAIVMSPSHVKLIWKQPLHINGILKHYLVTLKGLKTYNSSFLHQKTIAVNYTHFDVQNLYPGTTYFFNVKTENNVFVGPASNITTVVTPYDKPHAPPITVEKLGMQKTVLTLHSVSDETGPIRFYQLTIKKDRKLHCSYIPDNTTLLIATASTHVPLNVNIYKGVEDVTIAGTIIKFSLTETYLFCWRAVLNETGVLLYSIHKGVLLARNDLRAIGKATMVTSNTVSLKLSAGPSYIRYYQIIVAEDSINSSYPEPANLTPYFDSLKPGHPYITSEFAATMFNELRDFVVGNEKTYVSSVHDIKFFNVKLKPGTTYSIYLKSLYNETIFFSSPWSYFITLPQVVKATQSIVLARTGLETFISWSICTDFEIDTISCSKNNSVVALGTNNIFIPSNGFSKKVVTELKDKTYKLKIKNAKLEDSGTYNCKVLAKIQSQPKYFTESIKLVVTDIPLSYNISAQCNVRIRCNYRNVYFNSRKLEKDQLKKLFSSFVEAVFTRVKILFYELSASGSNILTEKGFVTENSIEFVITLQHNITDDVKEIEKLVHFILQRNRYKLFLHGSDFQADIIMTSMVVKDFNECESSAIKYCDDNAVCMNLPDWLSYACACSEDYEGNGFSCVKNEKEKSSKQYIIITGSIVTIILLIIIVVCIVKFKRQQKTKSTEKSLPEPVYTDLPYVTNASVIHNPVTSETYEDVKKSIELQTHYTGLVPTGEDVTYSELTSNKNRIEKSEYYENS